VGVLRLVAVGGALETIMAGLACGEPSLLAWQELQRSALAFVTIPDVAAIRAVQFLAERNLAIGESGAAGLGAYLSLDATEKCALGLDSSSRILLFGTEGVTDRKVYANILASRQI
jgi:diaminopropionate ammonia-lyase